MKSVNISELKAKLSHYIKSLKLHSKIMVLDRSRPVAVLSSIENSDQLDIQEAIISVTEVFEGMPALPCCPIADSSVNSTDIIKEDRSKR